MKTVKRTTIAILILTLLFSMAIPAMAAGPNIITINNSMPGHEYGAYQIFEGNISGTNFVDVNWGSGIDKVAFLAALKSDNTVKALFENDDCDTAAEVAKALGGAGVTKDQVNQFAKLAGDNLDTVYAKSTETSGSYTIGVEDGYYLVKDEKAVTGEDSTTMYILDVAKSIEVSPKNTIPTVEKKVLEDTDVTDRSNMDQDYNDVADWDINQPMKFRLYGNVTADTAELEHYDAYKFVFHDSFEQGISLIKDDGIAVVNYTVSYRVGTTETVLDASTFTPNFKDGELTFTCEDLKTVLGADIYKEPTIVITYDAMLNENAAIGTVGNQNGVYLEFSNEVYGTGTGRTPDDKVIVFTYELGAKKIDGETKKELAGAKFKLMNGDGAEAGYAVMSESNSVKFLKWGTEAEGTVFESPENGIFTIQGLDAGTYFLKEIDAPEGYNALQDPIELKIAASYSESNADIYKQDWDMTDASTAITTVDLSSGDTSVEDGKVVIENNSGFTLPETGGFGTTLIYVIGGILVIGVSVILITRKRMSNQD